MITITEMVLGILLILAIIHIIDLRIDLKYSKKLVEIEQNYNKKLENRIDSIINKP